MDILIVEDEALMGMWLQVILTKKGFNVCGVLASGEEAVEFAHKTAPDLVLMDIRLAGQIDGIEAAGEIRSLRNTPVIFMTGYSDDETKKRAYALCPVAYLVKPFTIADLTAAIALAGSLNEIRV